MSMNFLFRLGAFQWLKFELSQHFIQKLKSTKALIFVTLHYEIVTQNFKIPFWSKNMKTCFHVLHKTSLISIYNGILCSKLASIASIVSYFRRNRNSYWDKTYEISKTFSHREEELNQVHEFKLCSCNYYLFIQFSLYLTLERLSCSLFNAERYNFPSIIYLLLKIFNNNNKKDIK